MNRVVIGIGVLAAALVAGGAEAKDARPCPRGTVCASRPETVVAALQDAGYVAKLDKDGEGDPLITSSAKGYTFDVMFYGCEAHVSCDSLQFRLGFSPYENHSPELANEWNRRKRFVQASVQANKSMGFAYDISTIGGLNPANFADVVAWWASELTEIDKFFGEHPPGKKLS